MYNSYADIKQYAEKFTKGKIVPNHILKIIKGQKKLKHRITFGSDIYRMKAKDGSNIFFIDFTDPLSESVITMKHSGKSLIIKGSVYTQGTGIDHFFGNDNLTEQEYISKLNQYLNGNKHD